jgi:hypothetical protein
MSFERCRDLDRRHRADLRGADERIEIGDKAAHRLEFT